MTKSKRSLEGYLIVDNRHAPGPSAEQLAAFGRPVAGAGARSVFESATITCKHCHAVVVLNPDRSRPRGYCSKCDGYICDNPRCVLECQPLNAAFDRLQAQAVHSR